jgi:competence protein ComFB
MEKLVYDRLLEILHGPVGRGVCKCELCIEDMQCLALNKLPTKYVSTSKGELFSKIDQQMIFQNKTDIDFAIFNAIEFVNHRPRHDPAMKVEEFPHV